MRAIILKALKTTAQSLLFLVSLAVFAVLILTGTEGGSAWLIRTVLNNLNEGSQTKITAAQIEGTFFTDLSFRDLLVAGEPGEFRTFAGSVNLTLDPLALFNQQLVVSNLSVDDLTLTAATTAAIRVSTTQSEPADLRATITQLFNLPVQIRLEQFRVTDITIVADSRTSIASVGGNVQLDNNSIILNLDTTVDALTVVSADFRLRPGNFDLTGNIQWRTVVSDMSARGVLSLSGNLEQLGIDHNLIEPVTITTQGVVSTGLFDGQEPEFALRHEIAELTPQSLQNLNVPMLEQASGSVATVGTAGQISVIGNADVQVEQIGNIRGDFNIDYANEQIQIALFELVSDSFTFSGTGDAVTGDSPALNLDWQLLDFSDGELFANVTLEEVNAAGSVDVATTAEGLISTFGISTLDGTLNGYPLSGLGSLSMTDSAIGQVALELASGTNSLDLDGTVSPQLNINWMLQTPFLDRLVMGLSGRAMGSGDLTGTVDNPVINGAFTGDNLAFSNEGNQYSLASLNANARYAESGNELSLTFAGLELSTPENNILQDSGSLSVSGLLENHSLTVQSQSADFNLAMQAQGAWLDDSWQGALSSVQINSIFGNWRLQNTLPLVVSSQQAQVGNHCWEMQRILMCGQANWLEQTGLSGNLALDNLPLAYLNRSIPANATELEELAQALSGRPAGLEQLQLGYDAFMPANSFVSGELDLTMDFAGFGQDWAQTTLSLILVPRELSLGIVRLANPEDDINGTQDAPQVEAYGIDEVQLEINRRDSQWFLNSDFEIYLTESGGLDFQGIFGGEFVLGDDESLGGDFALTFNNIAWLEALVPTLRNVNGELGASGSIGGNLDLPELLMDANLANGSFELPEYGLNIQEVYLAFASDAGNELSIVGSANSGSGQVTLDSRMTMPLLETRELHIELGGENFELVNLPEARVIVDPELVLDYRDRVVAISGSLEVPEMRLDLRESQALAQAGSVDVSRDAVVVINSDGSVATATSEGLAGSVPVTGNVNLVLGDNVTFQGFGLDLFLTGNLQMEQAIDRPLVAHGELSIPRGSYGLYGQRLDIANGKLLFLGNPLNPALDIRASRQTNTADVGVYMNGTVRKIQARLYSTPALPEGEILSLLITGRSFGGGESVGDQEGANMLGAIALLGLEKGQGLTGNIQNKLGIDSVAIDSGADYRDSALGLGKYLSPKIFIRYNIGLFDRENVLTLDYLLSDRLKLEVETGVSQSVDLTYTVEK